MKSHRKRNLDNWLKTEATQDGYTRLHRIATAEINSVAQSWPFFAPAFLHFQSIFHIFWQGSPRNFAKQEQKKEVKNGAKMGTLSTYPRPKRKKGARRRFSWGFCVFHVHRHAWQILAANKSTRHIALRCISRVHGSHWPLGRKI